MLSMAWEPALGNFYFTWELFSVISSKYPSLKWFKFDKMSVNLFSIHLYFLRAMISMKVFMSAENLPAKSSFEMA